MIRVIYIAVFIFLTQWGFAQTKTVDVASKSGKKLHFDEIKIEGAEAQDAYKTLIIKYKNVGSAATTVENGQTYKSFPDKKTAVSAYMKEKSTAPSKVIYFVHSYEDKKPEVFTFRSQ